MTVQELLLDDPTICSDCLGRVAIAHDGGTHRDRSTTSYEHADGGLPTDCEELFCDCGSPSPFERVADVGAVNRDRFRELVKRAIRHLEAVDGLAISRKAFAGHALSAYDDGEAVTDALQEGLERGAA